MKVKAEFTFPGTLKDDPIICNLCKQFDITLSIIEASFSTDTGWAILIMEGEDAELKKALEFTKDKGVEMQNLQQLS